MSTLAINKWPQAPVVSANGTSAARSLRSYVWAKGGAKNERELKALAEKVPGAKWRDYMRLCLFERTDWGDGSEPSIGTVATLCGVGQAITNAMLLMTSLRAEQQAVAGAARVKTLYRVVVELEHVAARTVCWLDVETGEVIAGDVWRKSEEERLTKESKVLTEAQLEGAACVVCGGNGGAEGMMPLEVETRTSTALFHCCKCPRPDLELLKRQVTNSGAAMESGVAA